MLSDINTLSPSSNHRFDVCVIGSGPAGLAVAFSLEAVGKRVCILEAGGMTPTAKGNELARVRNVGEPCADPSQRRVFAFGGTSWMWSGWCRPFDPIDFKERDWVPDSGWPLGYEDVARYYNAAASFLYCHNPVFSMSDLQGRDDLKALPVSGGMVETRLFHVLRNTPRLGELYRERIQQSRTIELYTHAFVKHADVSADGNRITRVVGCKPSGELFLVFADKVVLAAGAIDNARILLSTERAHAYKGFKLSDTLGRYFMLRLHARMGAGLPRKDPRQNLALYDHAGGGTVGRYFVTPEAQRRYKLMRYNVSFNELADVNSPPVLSAVLAAGMLSRRTFIYAAAAGAAYLALRRCRLGEAISGDPFVLAHTAEQSPDRASRVSLADETNRFGVSRAEVEWRSNERDKRSFYQAARLVQDEVNREGLLRFDLGDFDGDRSSWPAGQAQGGPGHYMGTTRMGADRSHGVVDANCRVHGLDNMYVAGSSVFPTSGNGTPTLTIVALALRLAEHLRRHD